MNAKILWVCFYEDDRYTLGPLFEALKRKGFSVATETWHNRGGTQRVFLKLIGKCVAENIGLVVLMYPYKETSDFLRWLAVWGFRETGAKVVLASVKGTKIWEDHSPDEYETTEGRCKVVADGKILLPIKPQEASLIFSDVLAK